MGFGLIAVGLAALQIMLDRGNQDDWFGSNFIRTLAIISIITLVLGCLREWFSEDPVVDLRLLKKRTLLIANLVMFMIGLVLFGSTVLLPLFLQELMGYTATDAGLVITPGGFVVMAMMPIVGFLVSRVQARLLVAIGLAATAAALWHMTSFSLDISYGYAAWARIFQAAGLAFLFVPINTAAYSEVRPEQSNNFSALLNLSRNLGGSFGISIAQSLLDQRAQYHQSVLAGHLTAFSRQLAGRIHGLALSMSQHGGGMPHAMQQAYGIIGAQMRRQAMMLAYLDIFHMLAILCALLVPFVFLMKPNRPGKGPAMAH
jgi:DHA2 family multidrug resistance protein